MKRQRQKRSSAKEVASDPPKQLSVATTESVANEIAKVSAELNLSRSAYFISLASSMELEDCRTIKKLCEESGMDFRTYLVRAIKYICDRKLTFKTMVTVSASIDGKTVPDYKTELSNVRLSIGAGQEGTRVTTQEK